MHGKAEFGDAPFRDFLNAEKEKFEAEKEQYDALQKAYWDNVKDRENPVRTPSPTYTNRRDILDSCRKTTPNGGTYIALGEYYEKLGGW